MQSNPVSAQRPTPEELERVRPWIVETIREWDGGNYEGQVDEVLELVFGPLKLMTPKPSREDFDKVSPWIIDTVIQWARNADICSNNYVTHALAEVFPKPPDGFRDSNGFNCNGYGRDGFNVDGYDKDGFDRDGFDEDGFDVHEYSRDGFHRYRKTNHQGLTREEWFKTTPAGTAAFIKELGPEFIAALRVALQPEADDVT